LFEAVRQAGAEGIVSKRPRSPYRGGESRDWLKTRCNETGTFVITGFRELGEGRLEAVYVAEERDGTLRPAGEIRFGLAGKSLWAALDMLRAGPSRRGIVPLRPALIAEIKYFGRIRGFVRDGVVLSVDVALPSNKRAGL
jgi:bifunctional non-homologous end joining protein LigD